MPSIDGVIVVRAWHMDRLSPTEKAGVQPYLNQQLAWPSRVSATPCIPFMRLLAHKLLGATRQLPAAAGGPDAAVGVDLETAYSAAKSASMSAEGNAGVQRLFFDAVGT